MILSCVTIFLCFCIFSFLWLNFFFGAWGRPKGLEVFFFFFFANKAGRGHERLAGRRGGGCPEEAPWHPILLKLCENSPVTPFDNNNKALAPEWLGVYDIRIKVYKVAFIFPSFFRWRSQSRSYTACPLTLS